MDDPLAQSIPLAPPTLSLVSNRKVPNEFPTVDVPYQLAIVGEAPGADEEVQGRPFVGASGRLLDSILSSVGILRQGCFVGNVCQYRPPGNDIKAFGDDHPKVVEGFEQLKQDLQVYDPNCILCLGNTPLKFLTGKVGIQSWRGSILKTPGSPWKAVGGIHPAAVLREYKSWVLLRFDAIRAREESNTPTLVLPSRLLELDLTADEICHRLDNWPAGRLLSFDIEGGLDAFPCCSVADAPDRGFVIAWSRHSDEAQGRLYRSLSRILYDDATPKVLQNSLYDRFVLAYGYKMLIRNVAEDTMDKSWAIYPELKRGLATIASIWTREPYYKFERKTDDPQKFYEYCIKDSCVTLEACRAMEQHICGPEEKDYRFNVSLKSPLLYMELRGMRYDIETAQLELGMVKAAMAECASRLSLRFRPMQFTKTECSTNLCGAKGFLGDKRIAKVMYEQLCYPPQYKGRGPNKKLTTNVEALLNLSAKKEYQKDPFLSDILLHRKLESIRETLEWTTDPDGRIRCSYNQFSKGEDVEEEGGGPTETGRLRCAQSLTGSGGNLQTVTKKLRKLYLADEDHWLFQCDLAGADGWTVAAHCLRHGDSTMWDDYMFGLKPARIIALMYEHGTKIASFSREKLKEACKIVDDDGWLYFACKRIQHASNYGVKEQTVAKQIMVDSYKITGVPVYVDNPTCAALQRLYFVRYPGVYQWHAWAKREVAEGRNLTSASGHTRTFFGRRRSWNPRTRSVEADHETWKEFLADEPQENTTHAIKLALWKLWNSPDNRVEGRKLKVEPLHTVHDSIIGQFHKSLTPWALPKIKEAFNNELQIANTKVVIPFEGHYGESWGNLKEGSI